MKPKVEPAPRTWWVNKKKLKNIIQWYAWFFSEYDNLLISTTKPKSTKGLIKRSHSQGTVWTT